MDKERRLRNKIRLLIDELNEGQLCFLDKKIQECLPELQKFYIEKSNSSNVARGDAKEEYMFEHGLSDIGELR